MQLIPQDKIGTIVDLRDRSLEAYERYFEQRQAAEESLSEAREMMRLACGGKTPGYYAGRQHTEIQQLESALELGEVDHLLRTARRLLDARVWESVIDRTELRLLMDKQELENLSKSMQYVPEHGNRESGSVIDGDEVARGLPPVTVESVEATIERLMVDSTMIWRRGLANAFSNLDRRFRSHNGFKVGSKGIGSRVILSYCFSADWGGWSSHSDHKATIRDIERALMRLDGKPAPLDYAGIIGLIDQDRKGTGGWSSGTPCPQSHHENEYLRVRIFQNGNAHLWFLRPDLVELVNQELADYYEANTLGWGRPESAPEDDEAAKHQALMRSPAKNLAFFPTPKAVADRVISEAWQNTRWQDDQRRHNVLEPSAGTGNLAYPMTEGGHRVHCVELDTERASALKASGKFSAVYNRDFLSMDPDPGNLFDQVVMNPPFDRGRDIDHVTHALRFIKPGGRLVSVMAAASEFSTSKSAQYLHAELKKHTAKWVDLPARSFQDAGTMVNTVILKVTKT